jgi:hypothetical protein
MSRVVWAAFVAPLALATATACSDPVHDGAIAAQGKETTGVPIGEYHRAGQPCVVCHEEHGTASNAVFTVAGTVFAGPDKLVGVDGANIEMTDSGQTSWTAHTNCVGNFSVKPEQWNPKFPILVRVSKGANRRSMKTPIGREPSCSNCHPNVLTDLTQFGSVPHVYLFSSDDPSGPAPDCPVNPDLGVPQ